MASMVDAALPPAWAANTESCFSSAVPWHDGHSGVRSPRTSVSNRWWQVEQAYS